MYLNGETLLAKCHELGTTIDEIVILTEMKNTEASREDILANFDLRFKIMANSAHKALNQRQKTVAGLIEGVAKTQNDYAEGETLAGGYINRVMALAYSCSEVNASMGKICAAPTAGACGILPAVLIGVATEKHIDHSEIIRALITASAVGAIYTANATVAGAEGGCQAECGVAASMAAAAACQMMGGTNEQILDAANFAMINIMGLVCDPVAGLVQVPCAQRNASNAVNALISADMALAGQKCHLTFDEVVEAMYRVGKMLPPQLRETAQGGIAASKSAKVITESIFG